MKKIFYWGIRIIPALILWQTLYFKFSGAEESIYIFTTMGMEPWGRYLTGIAELIAGLAILIPRYSWIGAILAAGLMAGAIFSHLTTLGIVVLDDGGYLFGLAITVLIFSLIVLYSEKNKVLGLLKKNQFRQNGF